MKIMKKKCQRHRSLSLHSAATCGGPRNDVWHEKRGVRDPGKHDIYWKPATEKEHRSFVPEAKKDKQEKNPEKRRGKSNIIWGVGGWVGLGDTSSIAAQCAVIIHTCILRDKSISHLSDDPVVRSEADQQQVGVEAGEGDEADGDPPRHGDEDPPRYSGRRQRPEGLALVPLVGPDQDQHPDRRHVEVQQGAGHAQEVEVRVVAGADAGVQPGGRGGVDVEPESGTRSGRARLGIFRSGQGGRGACTGERGGGVGWGGVRLAVCLGSSEACHERTTTRPREQVFRLKSDKEKRGVQSALRCDVKG